MALGVKRLPQEAPIVLGLCNKYMIIALLYRLADMNTLKEWTFNLNVDNMIIKSYLLHIFAYAFLYFIMTILAK